MTQIFFRKATSLTIFLIAALLATKANAQILPCPKPTNLFVKSISNFSDLKCPIEQLRPECKNLLSEDPSLESYLKCGDNESEKSLKDIALSCIAQFPQPTIDSFKLIANAVASSIHQSLQNRKQFAEECRNDKNLKATLAASLASYSTYSQKSLAKVDCYELILAYESLQSEIKNNRVIANILAQKYIQSQKNYSSLEQSKDNVLSLIYKNYEEKMSCLNQEGRWLVRCYAFFSVVDPLLVAGVVAKAPSLFRAMQIAVKAADSSKLIASAAKGAEVAKDIALASDTAGVAQVRQALEKVMQTPKNPLEAAELARVDGVLYDEVNASLTKFSPEQRERLLKVMSQGQKVHPLSDQEINGMPSMKSGSAAINTTRTQLPHFLYQFYLADHPFMRSVVSHELSHLSRFDIGDVKASVAFKNATKILEGRPLGVYKEESKAWTAQYNFIKKAYTKEDLPRLRKLYPTELVETPQIKALKESGAITKVGSTYSFDFKKLPPGVDIEGSYQAVLRSQANAQFIKDTEGALGLKRANYVRNALRIYQQEQQDYTISARLNKYLRLATWVGPAAAAELLYEYETKTNK